jgi:L-threonylcarbamoyladenylate synthase
VKRARTGGSSRRDVLAPAVEALRDGLVVGIPTDTVYGLAADARLPGASARVFAAKGRPETVALPVLVADLEQASLLAGGLPREAEVLAARFWPGPLTMVLRRGPAAAGLELGGDPTTLGIRCPAHPLAVELLRRAGPLAVTSANRHGEPPLVSAASLRAAFGEALAAVVDGGRCDGEPSTVLRLTGGKPELLRSGALAMADVEAALRG